MCLKPVGLDFRCLEHCAASCCINSFFMQRFEKQYGRDSHEAVPRCIMAATFSSKTDPTGEATLMHWIKQGQIQDLCIKSLDWLFLYF